MFVEVFNLFARSRITVQQNDLRVCALLELIHENVDGDVLGRHVALLHERRHRAPLTGRLLALEDLRADLVAHRHVHEARVRLRQPLALREPTAARTTWWRETTLKYVHVHVSQKSLKFRPRGRSERQKYRLTKGGPQGNMKFFWAPRIFQVRTFFFLVLTFVKVAPPPDLGLATGLYFRKVLKSFVETANERL